MQNLKRKLILIFASLLSISGYSLDIEFEAYTGLGINLGADNLSKTIYLLPNIVKTALIRGYTYYDPKGTTIDLADPIRNKQYIENNRKRVILFNGLDQDTRDAIYYISRSANIEKTLLDGRVNIKDLGISFRTKLKSYSNRVDQRFDYANIDSIFFQLNVDNFLGELDLRYDLNAKDQTVRGIEKYLDKDYTKYTPKKDKHLNANGNLNVLKSFEKVVIKPKFYFNINRVEDEIIDYAITPMVSLEPVDGLSVEIGFTRHGDFTNSEIYNRKKVFEEVSNGALGNRQIEFYKKYTQGTERDIKNAVITSATGINRIDGTYSGSLYGDDVVDFALKRVRDFFIMKKYSRAKDVFDEIEQKDKLLIAANLIALPSFAVSLGNNLKNDLPELSTYVMTGLFDKIDLGYNEGYRKYDAISFMPTLLHPLVPGYENIYLGDKTLPIFNMDRAKEALNKFLEFQNKRDVIFYRRKKRPVPNIGTSPAPSVPTTPTIQNCHCHFMGTNIIDGKEYDVFYKVTTVGDDSTKYVVEPFKKYIDFDTLKNASYGKLFLESQGLLDKFVELYNHNEDLPQLDMFRGLYLYDTEYNYNRTSLYNELVASFNNIYDENKNILATAIKRSRNKALLDSKEVNNVYWLDDTEKIDSKYGINFNIKYKNKDNGIKFSLKSELNQPIAFKVAYSTAGKGGKRFSTDGNEYNIKVDEIPLTRIDSASDELAKGQRYVLAKVISRGWVSDTVHYITKQKRYFFEEAYNETKGNIRFDISFDKYGFNVENGMNINFKKVSYYAQKKGIVYQYDEGTMNSVTGVFRKNVKFSDLTDQTPVYELILKNVNLDYQVFNITSYLNFAYSHKVDQWGFKYGINWDTTIGYVFRPNVNLNGDNTFKRLKRDKDGNPMLIDGTSVIVGNETEYSLKDKTKGKVAEKAKDGLLYEKVPLESKMYSMYNGIEPYIEINYMPFRYLAFKNKIKVPLLFKDSSIDGFMLFLESGISIMW